MMMKPSKGNLPYPVRKRILEKCAENEPFVVVPKNGVPSRVFSLKAYDKMRNLPTQVKPWAYRAANEIQPDPLGAVEGKVLSSLRRADIYE